MNVERLSNILVSPILSEKTNQLADKKQYSFLVANDANKTEVKAAIKWQYGDINIKAVNILNRKGKVKRFKGLAGKPGKQLKRAYVTLDDTESVDLFEFK